jgi:hypothetical protein
MAKPAHIQPSMKRDPQPAAASAWRVEGDACIARVDLEAALQCFEAAPARSLPPMPSIMSALPRRWPR